MMKFSKYKENLYIILFFAVLAVVFTWPTVWHFFTSVPSSGPDAIRVIGATGEQANIIEGSGFFRGTLELISSADFGLFSLHVYV